jgi:hypothetical protein
MTLPVNSSTLNGAASVDADGNIVSYAWTKQSGPAPYTIVDPTAVTTGLTDLAAGTYVFRLKVTDNKGASAEDDVVVTVNPAATTGNKPPVANAGKDIVINLPVNNTTLDGSGSSDPDGSIASYAWSKQSGPTDYRIANAAVVRTAVTNLVAGTYVFRLKVTDNKGASSEDDVTVTVNPEVAGNKPPVANAGSDIVISLPVDTVTLNGSGSKDADGKIVLYAWTKISGPAQFSFSNPNAVGPTVTKLVAGDYVFRLLVKDDKGATSEDDVSVTVKAIPTDGPATLTVVVAPNPSTNYFTFRVTTRITYPVTIRVFNSRGNLVERLVRTGSDITFSLGTSWRSGTYYAVIEQGNLRRVVTLIKI